MGNATTFAVTVVEDGEDFKVNVQMINKGDLILEDAIDIFVQAAIEPDEAELTLESGTKVKLAAQ